MTLKFPSVFDADDHLQCDSQTRRPVCRHTEWSLDSIPEGASHSQPMDIFMFHRNHTRQSQEAVRPAAL